MSTYDDILEEYRRRKNGEANGTPDTSSPSAQTTGGSSYDDIAAEYQRIRGGGQTAPAVQEEQPVQPVTQRPTPSPLRPGRAALIQDETTQQQAQTPQQSFASDPYGFLFKQAQQQAGQAKQPGDPTAEAGRGKTLPGGQRMETIDPGRLTQESGAEDYAAERRLQEDIERRRRAQHSEYRELNDRLASGELDPHEAEVERNALDEKYGVKNPGTAWEIWESRHDDYLHAESRVEDYGRMIEHEQDAITRLQWEMNEQAFDPAKEPEYRQRIQEHEQRIQELRSEQLENIKFQLKDKQEAAAREQEAFNNLSPEEQHYVTRNVFEKTWDAIKGGSIKALTGLSSGVDALINFAVGDDGLLDMLSGGEWSNFLEGGVNNIFGANVHGNPYTELVYKPNRQTAAAWNAKADRIIGPDAGVQLAANATTAVEMMLPYILLNAYLSSAAAASTPSAAASAMRYTAAANTATSSYELLSLQFTHASLELAGNASAQYTFMQEFGNGLLEAEADGADKKQAALYALYTATLNTIIEFSGGVEDVNANLSRNPYSALSPREMVSTIFHEDLEELAQGFVGDAFKAVYQEVNYFSGDNPVISKDKIVETLVNTTIATPFITLAQVGVTHGFARVSARVDARDQRTANQIISTLDEAAARDQASENPESDADLIRALEEIGSNRRLSRVFKEMYKTTPQEAIESIRQTEAAEAPAETPSVSPGADSSLTEGATGEEEGSSGTPTPTNPVRPQEAAGRDLAQGGTETAVQTPQNATAQAPVLNSNEGATAARSTPTDAARSLQEKHGANIRLTEARTAVSDLSGLARETDFSDPEQVRRLWTEAKQRADSILRTTENPGATASSGTGSEIRDYLKGTKIKIDERLRGDVPAGYENLQALRQKTFGTVTFSNTEGRTVDEVYAELADMFPGFFPQDVYSHSDMLERILDAVANERGTRYTYAQSLSKADYDRTVAELTMDLLHGAESVTGETIPTPTAEAQQSMTAEQAREAAIQRELDADFEGELSREDAERIVDERFEQYGTYDLDEILNSFEEEEADDEYGGEDAFDEYAYYAEQFHGADGAGTGDGAAAETAADEGRGPEGETKLPATVGPRALAGGSAENDGAGAGGLREPGSAASVNGENGPKEGQKRSKTESHTEQNIAGKLGGEQDAVYYTPKSERESLTNAINRVNSDFNGEVQRLSDKAMWTGEDIDTALTIYGFLQMDGVRTGDFSAAQAWGRLVSARGTESGRALQAFSKWTRTGAAAATQSMNALLEAKNLTEEDRTRITNDVYQFAQDYDSIEDGDLGSVRDLIKRQAKYRNTWTFAKKNFDRMLNEVEDFDWLKEFALRQMMNICADFTEDADLGQKVKTWQVNAQLSRLGTFFRNIGGNGVFGVQDTLSQDFFGVALDALVGKMTGKRTVAMDRGWLSSDARRGARQGLIRSILEVAGDVDMGEGGSKYGQGSNRTFKMTGGAFSRMMSRWEQALGYSLTSSDRFFRGGIEAEQLRGLSQFENLTDEERQALAQNMADYRLFQNHGLAYRLAKGIHDVGNVIGFGGQLGQTGRQGGFGAADLVMPYPGVPANLWAKALEYNPANIVKGGVELFNLWRSVKNGTFDVTKQQNAVMDVARGLHGTALLALLTAAFSAGIFRNADDEDDPNAQALARAEGRQGVQINLSAAWRWLNGKGYEWKDGDELMKIDWLEPMNAFMAIASLMANEDDFPGYAAATLEGSLQAALDMPVMENLSNLIDSYNYSKADTTAGKIGDAAVSFGVDALTGFLPAPISQTARAMDPYQRDTAGEDALDTARRRLYNAIPGLRQTLPEKLDNFGNPVEQAESAYDRWMNSFVRPGAISDYKAPELYEALDKFAERTGDKDIYPDRKAPTSFGKDENKVDMTPEERQLYQETYGKTCEDYYSSVLLGDAYKDLPDGEKQWLLGQIQDYAKHRAQQAVLGSRGESREDKTWDKVDRVAAAGVNPADYLLGKKQADTDGSGGTPSNQEVYNWLLGSDYSDRQQEAIWDATKGTNVHSWEEYRDTNPVTYLMNAGLSQKGAQRMYAQINTDGRSDLTQRELYQYYLAHPEAEELIREYWDNQRGFSQSWDKKKRNPDKDWTD